MINHADPGQGSYFAMSSGPITKVGNQIALFGSTSIYKLTPIPRFPVANFLTNDRIISSIRRLKSIPVGGPG